MYHTRCRCPKKTKNTHMRDSGGRSELTEFPSGRDHPLPADRPRQGNPSQEWQSDQWEDAGGTLGR
eukprot:7904060-Pyramimonas_sp.AAC.1